MKYSEDQLYNLWKKNIHHKMIYKVISMEYVKNIKKYGLNPKEDPNKKMKAKIKQLFNLIKELERKSIIYYHKINKNIVKGSYLAKRSEVSLDHNFLDFTPNYKQANKFKKKWKGGALTTCVYDLCQFLRKKRKNLNKKENKLIEDLLKWANKKRKFKNKIIFLKGSSQCFKSAKFQINLKARKNQGYYDSPFGDFENFKKIIKKEGLSKYAPFLQGNKKFYLRVIKKVSPKEIIKIL